MIQLLTLLIFFKHSGRNRINPYPPNFNKTAAKTIDPSRGASTWALGNHKCKKYMGILAKKAIINNKIKLNFIIVM